MASRTATTTKKPPKIKQACDCCHARKIRCNGAAPCNNCEATSLPCTYLLIPKKKGPKGPSLRTPRAVLKMRMNQEQSIVSEATSSNTGPTLSPPLVSPIMGPPSNPGSSSLRGFEPAPCLTMKVVGKHVETFFKHKYPVFPILDRQRFQETLKQFHTSPEVYALVTSLCAAIVSQTQPDTQSASSTHSSNGDATSPEFFINEAKRAKASNLSYVEKPHLRDAQTNFFLFAALFNLDRHNAAWFHLREAMTMVQMLRLHEEDTYAQMEDELEALYSRRTFWLLFITERAYALQRHRPLTLQRTISLPTASPDEVDAGVLSGFLDLVSLFQNFDDTFVSLWNKSNTTPTLPFIDESSVSSNQLEMLQSVLQIAIPEVSKRNEIQQADLLITRQWLKTMVWQLCVTKGLLSSSSKDESMSFTYPIAIARDVVLVSQSLSKEAFEPHGVGILEKIFDIGCSLADVLQLNPVLPQTEVSHMQVGPRDYLMEMLKILSTVLGGQTRYLPMLADKVDECTRGGIRPALETNAGRIVDLDDEANSYSGSNDAEPGMDGFDTQRYPDTSMFDFGALSEASMAWLGSMSDDTFGEMAAIPDQMPDMAGLVDMSDRRMYPPS